MSSENPVNEMGVARRVQSWTSYGLGLVVFALGIVLLLLAFYWGYQMLAGVDEQLSRVETTQPAESPAEGASGGAASAAGEVVRAQPPGENSLTLTQVLVGTVIKLVTILVLAGIGAMIAGRGAQMAGVGAR